MLKKGFTLIELLIVISVIGILVLIGMPAFRDYQPSLELSGVSRNLITDLRYAQQLAVSEQVDYSVLFLVGRYEIIRHGQEEEIIRVKTLPSSIHFSEITGFIDDQVFFNPYGAAREAGTIVLINNKNQSTTIDVRPSGFVRIIK